MKINNNYVKLDFVSLQYKDLFMKINFMHIKFTIEISKLYLTNEINLYSTLSLETICNFS